ncbi:hypothetical protein [Brevundimonas sp.]
MNSRWYRRPCSSSAWSAGHWIGSFSKNCRRRVLPTS